MRKLLIALATAAALAAAGTAAADTGVSTSGGTTVAGGVATLTSNLADTQTTNDASSITFALPAGTTFADLKTLSADYNVTVGDCGGGSPRFSITLADNTNVFVYLGPGPNYVGCPLNTWTSTGNLIGTTTTNWDLTKEGGAFYATYADALAAVGSKQVTSVSFVVDAGGMVAGHVQTVLAKNVTVNTMTFPAAPGASKSPAQLCKAELASLGKTVFEQRYGSNHSLRNAFGKCVSEKAKAKHSSSAKTAAAAKRHHGR